MESGVYERPTAEVLQAIATALDIDPAKLLRFIGVKPSTKLPAPRVYFRRAYGMTAEEAAEAAARVDEIVRELREHKRNNKQSKGGTRP
jgi:transcriptional regulator with XRE-family HTH domain